MVSNRNKKTVCETEEWRKPGVGRLQIDTWWRGGTWYVTPEGDEPIPVDGQDGIDISDYSNYELDSTWDGCSCEINFLDDLNEEEQTRIEEGFHEDGTSFLEEDGWESYECFYVIHGEVEVKEEKPPWQQASEVAETKADATDPVDEQ